MARARRGLGDVFHYFISDAEQADLRARSATAPAPIPGPEPAPAAAPRWLVPVDPARPLGGALVVDLAAALARAGLEVEILAAEPPGPLVPRAEGVEWCAVGESDHELWRALAARPPHRAVLIALPRERAARALAGLPADLLRGVIIPVDAAPRGLGRSLALLRQLRRAPTHELEIGALVVGAEASAEADVAFRRLRSAAERQLGVSLVSLGELPHDAATFRSLLRGVAVVDLDEQAVSARSLRALGARLSSPSAVASRV
jgi:hypothetical protein